MTTPNREQIGQVVLNTILRTKNPPNSGLLALEVADAILAQVGTVEWGIQEKPSIGDDVPFRKGVDDGRSWSDRHGKAYTENEVREEIKVTYNGHDPKLWRRVMKRVVLDWEPES